MSKALNSELYFAQITSSLSSINVNDISWTKIGKENIIISDLLDNTYPYGFSRKRIVHNNKATSDYKLFNETINPTLLSSIIKPQREDSDVAKIQAFFPLFMDLKNAIGTFDYNTYILVKNKYNSFVCQYMGGSNASCYFYDHDGSYLFSRVNFWGVAYDSYALFGTFDSAGNITTFGTVSVDTSFVDRDGDIFAQIRSHGETNRNVIEWINKSKPFPTDPYDAGGTSTANGGSWGGGGGTGDFDNTSDTIGLPSLPSLSGLNTGFFTAFIPSASQMQSVSNYLWNNFLEDIIDPESTISEKVDALKKIIANPYDAIMGCSVIPVTPPTAGSKELKMYGLIDTGISIPYASTRWVTVDCGTLNIHEFWGGYLDYSPYTKTTSLYLPYIGTVSIDIDLIMAKALQVVYRVDILSGICVAFILVDGSVKFHYQGQCATQIPITNADYSSVISAGIGLIGSASQVVGSAVAGASTGGPVGAVVGAVGSAVSQAPSVASNVMGAKPDIRSGGSVGSSAGILSVQRPYLIIERPRQSAPESQNTFTGYPSNVTASVGDLTGYTEFETINLDNLFLTDAEKEELSNILKGGVYL